MTADIEPSIEIGKMQGALILSAFVTDGHNTWLHTERYFDYSKDEAIALFNESVKNNGWKEAA
jgi:hypothetical protein